MPTVAARRAPLPDRLIFVRGPAVSPPRRECNTGETTDNDVLPDDHKRMGGHPMAAGPTAFGRLRSPCDTHSRPPSRSSDWATRFEWVARTCAVLCMSVVSFPHANNS